MDILNVLPAEPGDVGKIWELLATYAHERLLLARPQEDIQEKLKNFRVGDIGGEFVCCLALRNFGGGIYEVRSLAVRREYNNRGIGSKLVQGAIDHLKAQGGPCRVFALTYRAHFFHRLGFQTVDKELFPQKIWSDCSKCPKKEHCDETAVLLELN